MNVCGSVLQKIRKGTKHAIFWPHRSSSGTTKQIMNKKYLFFMSNDLDYVTDVKEMSC